MKLKLISCIFLLLIFSGCKSTQESKMQTIDSLEELTIGGVKQWIYTQSNNPENPVLLWIHGGPGYTAIPWAYLFPELKKKFTFVAWDQRCAGKSFSPETVPVESLNIEQFVADSVELINVLKKRYNQDKVYIFGHSWGSILGTILTARYPELFHAYISGGQVVDLNESEELSYQYVMDEAIKLKNKAAIKELKEIGPPPYKKDTDLFIQRKWLWILKGVYANPEYDEVGVACNSGICSKEEAGNIERSLQYSASLMWDELLSLPDFRLKYAELKVPVYFLIGKNDYNTPWKLVENYYQTIKAPRKKLIWFEKSAHMFPWTEPDKFQKVLINTILPETYN